MAKGMCPRCGEPKNASPKATYCRPCAAAYLKARREANPDVDREYQRQWQKSNPDKMLKYKRKWILKSQYGMTVQEFDAMLEKQAGLCAICSVKMKPGVGGNDNLCVDHCHDAGHVRGLLCGQCNFGVGNFKNDPDLLVAAAAYLINSERKVDR